MNTLRQEYDKLLASGMFWEFYPYLTGTWKNDKYAFRKLNKEQEAKRSVATGDQSGNRTPTT